MATYVGGVTFGVGAGPFTLSGALTGGIAASPATGDTIIVLSGTKYNSAGAPGTTTTCTGNNQGAYTSLGMLWSNGSTTNDVYGQAWYSYASGTADTTITFGSSEDSTCVHVWRDLDSSTQMDVSVVTATGTGGDNPDSAAITPVTTNAVVLTLGVSSQSTTAPSHTAPTGYGNSVVTNTTSRGDAMIASNVWSGSGAENPGAWTGGTGGTGLAWCAWTVALRPKTGVTINSTVTDIPVAGVNSTLGAMWVLPSDVRSGVVYGPTGSEFTGTLAVGSGMSRGRITNA